jgi:hypothetical protein
MPPSCHASQPKHAQQSFWHEGHNLWSKPCETLIATTYIATLHTIDWEKIAGEYRQA